MINILIYAQPFQTIFEHGPLPLPYWLFLVVYPSIMFLAKETRKAVMRRTEARRPVRQSKLAARPV